MRYLISLVTLALAAYAHPTTAKEAEAPSLDEFLAESSASTIEIAKRSIRRADNTTTVRSAGVKLCTEPDFAGECTHSSWPINQCVELKGYAGVTKSFIPDDGFECLLMQGECDATIPYIEIGDSDQKVGGDLTNLSWIDKSNSYICFTEIEQVKRFVRVAKLRAKMKLGQ